MNEESSSQVSSSGIIDKPEKKAEKRTSRARLLDRLEDEEVPSCHVCLIEFLVLFIQLVNTHTESSEYLRFSLALILSGLQARLHDIFVACATTHANHPPENDCSSCSRLVFDKILACLMHYHPNSCSLLIDVQSIYENMVQTWISCENGCRPAAPLVVD